MHKPPSGYISEFWLLGKCRKSQGCQNYPVIAWVPLYCPSFLRSTLFPSYCKSQGLGWQRILLKHWTTWWRWRSAVKSEGCPWYPWQWKTGQRAKFSEACQDGKGEEITIANWGAPSTSVNCKLKRVNWRKVLFREKISEYYFLDRALEPKWD